MKCPCGYEWKPRVENPKACPECKRRLKRNLEARKVQVKPVAPLMEKAVPADRVLLQFRERYRREPANEIELEGFRKRGW